ncbi:MULTISPECIES: phosphate ABC transporter ATP-binding protein PstB [Nostoc]|uniref:Phosphate ABC transporter ATP-binding protein n=1 Tax=Nostoc paludosum FACHB-159 TaxID=2692908 RepID=A0ABR8KF44_9NOSO|nr:MULTISPECIES: phosphate ABC transporter ATP-binding protein PstB [Nostoc]MBD2681763.1 phosphate ABC transporter ATP-binding protein [Nostoc sp. FACHB-857]MBD2738178.1 phosphate ABC transporter ATP-binding protein [Nostoc paludosum FACHB-159]
MINSPTSTTASNVDPQTILHAQVRGFYYGKSLALRNIDLPIYKNQITAFIGPSGCGKSTLLRCFNRLNDMIPETRLDGQILFKSRNVYHPQEDALLLRRHIGMVFQKPNPFPKSIYDNVAFAPRIHGLRGDLDELVERSLRQAALWDEVKDKLKQNALKLSGGQQQRLCIARSLAIQPEVILMDEPCSALDPITASQIEELMKQLKEHTTIIIVTHNMQQAARLSQMTAFFNLEMQEGSTTGELVEYDHSPVIFQQPKNHVTQQYVNGYFG